MHIRGFERFDNRAIPGDRRLTNIRGVAAMRDRRQYVYLIGSRANQLGRRQESLCIVGVAFALGKHATTDSDHDGPIFPNLAKDVTADGPNQLWVADITYVAIAVGFVYVAVILDAWSRRVVGYAISRSIDARLTIAALKAAIRSRRPPAGCIHHSDSEYLRAGSLGVT